MYKRGRYYNTQRRYFGLFSRPAISLSVALAVIIGGAMTVTQASGEANYMSGRARVGSSESDRKSSKQKSNKTKRSDAAKSTDATAGQVLPVAPPSLPGVASLLDLASPDKKEIAMRLVSSAENSSLDWRAQFAYIEDIGDGRGYTAGIIGFCSGTGDMLQLIQNYTKSKPGNVLASFLPALKQVDGTASHIGLDAPFVAAWKLAASDSAFQQAQEALRDEVYFKPALALAKADGLSTLGQFMYYDAAVMHGPNTGGGLADIRNKAAAAAKTPTQGGDQKAYLQAFMAARKVEMAKESAHRDVSRVDDTQAAFLQAGNYDLNLPLSWSMYGDKFTITTL